MSRRIYRVEIGGRYWRGTFVVVRASCRRRAGEIALTARPGSGADRVFGVGLLAASGAEGVLG